MKTGLVVAICALLSIACGGTSTGGASPSVIAASASTRTLNGTIRVSSLELSHPAVCEPGPLNLATFGPGAEVLLKNESSTLIGKSTLTTPPNNPSAYSSDGHTCLYSFAIPDVPDAKFYSITAGGIEGPTYSFEDLNAKDWTVELTLG